MAVVEQEVDDMLSRNIIQPSKSPQSAPIVLVTNKDGSNRMCDFRKLSMEALHGSKVFSSLDLASGYWLVPIAASAIPKTAFVTPDGGHYGFLRLPFGLCNAPGKLQRLMTAIFNEYLFSFLIFLDDVLVFSKSEEDHEEHLRIVFEAVRNANLKLKPKKGKLYQNSVTYLRYKISAERFHPMREKSEH